LLAGELRGRDFGYFLPINEGMQNPELTQGESREEETIVDCQLSIVD
jgi:hypothetical protein